MRRMVQSAPQQLRSLGKFSKKPLQVRPNESCLLKTVGKTVRNMSELPPLRELGKTPPAVCPCCVQAFVMLPVAR